MLNDFRKSFPFAVGTTSYIYPYEEDNLVENVRSLKNKTDIIQLLFFGKDYIDDMCQKAIIKQLDSMQKESDIRYILHLPIDFYLMDLSKKDLEDAVNIIQFIIDSTKSLEIDCYILHIDFSNKITEPDTLKNYSTTFKYITRFIKKKFKTLWKKIVLENTNYDLTKFSHYIKQEKFRLCMDLGHLAIQGLSLKEFIDIFHNDIEICHLHGYTGSKDHQALSITEKEALKEMVCAVYRLGKPVILEVFNETDLILSYQSLKNYNSVPLQISSYPFLKPVPVRTLPEKI
ncbi:MAG: cobamide remodeling phosphodiesterase CbiR [Candidatus Eremiobacterota bacterium]